MKKARPDRSTFRLKKGAGENPRNLLTSLVLILPLLLTYQVGVLFTLPMLNGADFLTVFLFQTLGLSQTQYLLFLAGVWIAFGAALVVLRKTQGFNPRVIVPVLLESSIYALCMGSVIILVMTRVLGVSPDLSAGVLGQGIVGRFVMSLGAGVYEELVFRLALLGGLAASFQRLLGWGRWFAVVAAFILSAVAFSAVHHLPPYGDPLSVGVFVFRVLAGLCFGLLYWFRGLAVAVYTHALYDVYVLLVR
jgi:membrane protease YdiL (CAAX protease family)